MMEKVTKGDKDWPFGVFSGSLIKWGYLTHSPSPKNTPTSPTQLVRT